MVKIEKAKPAGFCFGVQRAVTMAKDALGQSNKIYSLGPVIHNPFVVKELAGRGIKVISDIRQARDGKILIRSHGIQPSVRSEIENSNIDIIDATCPFVERSHRIVEGLKHGGFYIIIVGEKDHPEVKALSEAAGSNKKVVVNKRQLKDIAIKNRKIGILAQSTLTKPLFNDIVNGVLEKNPQELRIFNTICMDVTRRQHEAKRLSRLVDMVLVVGGRMSANTKRLAQLCRAEGVRTYHVESEDDIEKNWLKKAKFIGVISGSSTPDWIVRRVIDKIKKMKNPKPYTLNPT